MTSFGVCAVGKLNAISKSDIGFGVICFVYSIESIPTHYNSTSNTIDRGEVLMNIPTPILCVVTIVM